VIGAPGAWHVTQVTDGVAICGPFKDRANAERWIAEHGPTRQIAQPTRQKDRVFLLENAVEPRLEE
jgi:hypothetical protein